jgi:mannose-1-phosphate guanylyltransferase
VCPVNSARYGEDVVVSCFPADGWIGEPEEFEKTLEAAAELVRKESAIATLGFKSSYASTGHGYKERTQKIKVAIELFIRSEILHHSQ